MTYKTHKQYSIAFAYITLMLLYTYKVFEFNYYLCFPVVILVSQWGAKFPDLDHEFKIIKDKNVLTWVINKLIHLTGGKHRSWQTHSWDICIIYTVLSTYLANKFLDNASLTLALLINSGFVSGWISHLFSDTLNGVGVRLLCWLNKKVHFVPRKIGKFKFNTGGEWEDFNYFIMRRADVVLGLVAVIYPYKDVIKETIVNLIYQV